MSTTAFDNLALEFPDQLLDPNSKRKTSVYDSYDDIETRRFTAQLIPPLTSRTTFSRCGVCFVASLTLVSLGFMAVGLLFFTGVLGALSTENGPESGFQIGEHRNSSDGIEVSPALKDLLDRIDSLKQDHDDLSYKINSIEDTMSQIDSKENYTTLTKILTNSLKLEVLEEHMTVEKERLVDVAHRLIRVHRLTQNQQNLINTLQDELSNVDTEISALNNETYRQKNTLSEMHTSSAANSDIISALIALHFNDSQELLNLYETDVYFRNKINDTVGKIETTHSSLESHLAEFNLTALTDVMSTSKKRGPPGVDGPVGPVAPMGENSLSSCIRNQLSAATLLTITNVTATTWIGDVSLFNGELHRMLWSGCSTQAGTESVLQIRNSNTEHATYDFRCYCYGEAVYDHSNGGKRWCVMSFVLCPSVD